MEITAESVVVLTGETELGKTVVLQLTGPLSRTIYALIYHHGWGIEYNETTQTIYFAPSWAMDDPLEIHAKLPWKPEVWGIQDDERWMAMRDGGEESTDLRHGDGSLLILAAQYIPTLAEA